MFRLRLVCNTVIQSVMSYIIYQCSWSSFIQKAPEPFLLNVSHLSLVVMQLENANVDIHKEGKYLMLAVQELVSGDQCEGRFVFGRQSKKPQDICEKDRFTKDGTNPKSLLQTLLMRAGHSPPKYKVKHLKTNEFRALVEFKGMQFVGKPKRNKQLAERDAAIEALAWLTHTTDNSRGDDDDSPPDVTDNMLKLLGKRRRSKRNLG